MIEIKGISKTFQEICAIRDLTLEIKEGEVFGLVGTNGAGKSTLLRMISGIYKPDAGSISIDGTDVWEQPAAKEQVFYLSDEAYTFPNSTPFEMMRFYRTVCPNYEEERFHQLMRQFHLDEKRKIRTFSKGMRKQLQLLLGLCSGTKYLLCDETFDGLDPVMRQAVKSLIAGELMKRRFTPVIASHNLRELEDICDRVGLLHEGGILFARDLEDMKLHLHKVQCVIPDPQKEARLLERLNAVLTRRQGSLLIFTAWGMRHEIEEETMLAEPVFSEILPLSLEEIFITETEAAGYDIKNLIS